MAGGLDLEVLSKKFGNTNSKSMDKVRHLAEMQATGSLGSDGSSAGPERDY